MTSYYWEKSCFLHILVSPEWKKRNLFKKLVKSLKYKNYYTKLLQNPKLSRTIFQIFKDISFINYRTFVRFFKKNCIKFYDIPELFYGVINNGFRTTTITILNDP